MLRPTKVTANLAVPEGAAARAFYRDFLGLSATAFDLGWVVNLQSPDGRAEVQLVTSDETSPVDSHISVHVGNAIDEAYAEALERGLDIVHPLVQEEWGVRRFMVRDPGGNVVNIVSHVD